MKNIRGISFLALMLILSIGFVNAQEEEEQSKSIQKEVKV